MTGRGSYTTREALVVDELASICTFCTSNPRKLSALDMGNRVVEELVGSSRVSLMRFARELLVCEPSPLSY